MLAFAIARRWPDVLSNSLEPGWVPTKMGGSSAPDDMDQAHRTQVWLAASDDPKARVTGGYFYHLKSKAPSPKETIRRYRTVSSPSAPISLGSLCLRETPFYRAPHLHRVPRSVFQGPDQVRGTSDYARG
jgi:hypothetical protein